MFLGNIVPECGKRNLDFFTSKWNTKESAQRETRQRRSIPKPKNKKTLFSVNISIFRQHESTEVCRNTKERMIVGIQSTRVRLSTDVDWNTLIWYIPRSFARGANTCSVSFAMLA